MRQYDTYVKKSNHEIWGKKKFYPYTWGQISPPQTMIQKQIDIMNLVVFKEKIRQVLRFKFVLHSFCFGSLRFLKEEKNTVQIHFV